MATYYFRNVGTAWNDTSSWSIVSSSGASAGVIPTAADAVIFDAGSANACPVSTTNGVCLTLTTTGWTGTFTLSTVLKVYGNIVLSATTNWAGASYLQSMVSSTITTQGSLITNYLIGTNTNITITLADNLFLSGYLKVGETSATATYTINASTPGNYISVGTNFQFVNGSTGIVINGTAAILIGNNTTPCNVSDTTFNNVSVYNTIYIQGNVIFGAAFRLFGAIYFSDFPSDFNFFYSNRTTLWLGNGSSINVNTADSSLSAQEIMDKYQLYQIGFLQTMTTTLNVNVYSKFLYFYHTATNTTTINGGTIYIGEKGGSIGSMTGTPAGGSIVTGTSTLEFVGIGGVGTWQGNGTRSMNWNININIRTQGTLYIYTRASSNVATAQDFILFGGSKTFAYYTGTVITKSLFYIPSFGWANFVKGGWLQVATNSTLIGFNKIAWGRIVMPGGGTVTMDEFPCGNPNIQTIMYSSTSANYTINLTGTNNERVAQFIEVKNCTLGTTSRNKVIVTHPKGNAGNNSGLRFGDIMGHGIPKSLETNQIKYKNGKEIAYGAMGLVSDPNFSSI